MPDLSNVLITYQVKVNRITATALLDTRAQLDFINKAFTDRHNIATIKTSEHYVKMANGLRQDTSQKFQDATIDIQGFKSSCSPLVTVLGQFDLILGMPWLTDIQPTINFTTKDATVTFDNGDIFTIKANLRIPTEEQHIASLNAIEFARFAGRCVDFFLGWMQQ
jgi:hypothetical protein